METNSTKSEPKETLNPHSVVVFFPTFYGDWSPNNDGQPNADRERGNASISTVTNALAAGYRTVVVDGGSSEAYVKTLEGLGVEVVPQREKGMVAAKRQSLEVAASLEGAKVLLLIQAEKDDVIKDVPQLVNPIINNEADLVVAAREPHLFEQTYPDFQFASETWANKWYNKIAHMVGALPEDSAFDWFFGVKAFKNDPTIVRMFMSQYTFDDPLFAASRNMDPDRYSNFDFFPILAAVKNGKRVASVEIPFQYPINQKQLEETLAPQFVEKRRMQRQSILAEFVQYARLITNNPKNHLMRVMEKEADNFQNS